MKKEIKELVEYALTASTNIKKELVIGRVTKAQAQKKDAFNNYVRIYYAKKLSAQFYHSPVHKSMRYDN